MSAGNEWRGETRRSARAGRAATLLATTMLSAGIVDAAGIASAVAQSAAQSRDFDIAPQSLSTALRQFADQSGMQLAYRTSELRGLKSPGVKGPATPLQALARILAGSSVSYHVTAANMVTIERPSPLALATEAPDGAVPLDPIDVGAEATANHSLASEGKAADGYRVKSVSSLGALGRRSLLDTPFAVSVTSQELIRNIQAMSPDDVFKLNPFTRTLTPQGAGWTPVVTIRGFNTSERAEDGLRRATNFAQVLEDKERVEVLSGLSGFMYGAASPAGMINYVYKRPTIERFNQLTLGNYGGDQYYVHGDFGGRVDDAGSLGYRLNIVKQDGGTPIDYQKIDRFLVSGALDWQIADKLLFEFNGVHNHYKTTSPNSYWYHDVPHSVVPNPSKNWSQTWIKDEFSSANLIAKLTYTPFDNVTLRAAGALSDIDRPVQDHTMNYVPAAGVYEQLRQRSGATRFNDEGGQLLADVGFDTGPLAHKVTAGYYTYSTTNWTTTYAPHTGYQGPYSMMGPTFVSEPAFQLLTTAPYNVSSYYSDQMTNENLLIGDEIQFGSQWSALLGINRSTIKTQSFNASGVRTQPDYDRSYNAPSASLMFKPIPSVTFYGSYIEGLETGGQAPATAANAYAIMPPMISKQKELGVKAEVGGVLLTTALFDIEKAYELTNSSNIYTQDGRERHKGFELAVSGKPIPELAIYGGLTVLDAKISGGSYDGKDPINVANFTAKLYSEYSLPIPGLTFVAGVFHTGEQWGDDANTDRLPSYTTLDLGARYETTVMELPVTFRVNASNVTNNAYWANAYYLGAPRTVAFSAAVQF
ncbi:MULTISPECIES: TonB-dependent receptor [Methylosinus]|uniref:TonB-dependent siderophore receptor n=2 Tax=Methylosinus trichosporium TaxID=426 RepID=A0A2D2D6Y7_METT3|nr:MULTISPECIES: TonB-dependent receptor [Methylosinus]ATQ70715.1 TonB-dependent siderophore receptor [Methylosinus trichosporium OB3b]